MAIIMNEIVLILSYVNANMMSAAINA